MSSSAPRAVRTRICIISDTHNSTPTIPACDILLHCGDLTISGRPSQLQQQLTYISSLPAELKLVIAGNHDITLDRAYYNRMGNLKHSGSPWDPGQEESADACLAMWKSEAARARGVRYLEEGMHTFTLRSGAVVRVYASPYQPEYCDWAFPYERHEDRFNPTPTTPAAQGGKLVGTPEGRVPNWPEVDVMVTHGPPQGVCDETTHGERAGCGNLLRAAGRARPRVYCFGHIHEGWGGGRMMWREAVADTRRGEWHQEVEGKHVREGEEVQYMDLTKRGGRGLRWGEETAMVNASIMNVRYRPVQKPWVVDLDLLVKEVDGEGMDGDGENVMIIGGE